MIRPATLRDIPEMLTILRRLHGMAERPYALDPGRCAATMAQAVDAEDWLALVVDRGAVEGLLLASAGPTTASPARVGVEHAWIAPAGWGAKLAAAYETWAREQGCVAISLSAHPEAVRLIETLEARGFAPAELALVKVL